MEGCRFCQIIAGKAPADIVHEDDRFISFLDIRPLTRGNCLVIPRQHVRWADDVEDFGAYFEEARRVGKAAQRALGSGWTQYFTIGHEVPHAHIRVVPRYPDDAHGPVPDLARIEDLSEAEMGEIAQRIREEIIRGDK